jgi:hypothetical protein
MKKISLIALALSTSLAMFAQNENVTKMATATRFGLKAGVNLAKLRPSAFGSNEPSTNLKTTFGGGAFVNIPLGTGGFSVQPEALYSRQGSKMTQTTTVGTQTTTSSFEQDLGYINVPVMLQWKSAGGFFVETGPQAGFLIHAQQEGPGNDQETENKDMMKPFDFAWGAGIGYLSRIGLAIGARYNHGFRNVLDNDADENPSLRNSVVNIGLAWHFGAGK